jgi:ribosomal protein L40E
MSLLSYIRRHFEDSGPCSAAEVEIHECRRCGTTLNPEDDHCYICKSDQLVTYCIS